MKFMKKLMELLPVKSVVLLPIFFVFVATLAGCGSSETATTIVIRDLLSASETLWDDLSVCGGDEVTYATWDACAKAVFEALPPITGNTAPLVVDEGEESYRLAGLFYAGLNTGPAASNAITWALTINNAPRPDLLEGDEEFDDLVNTTSVTLPAGTTGTIQLTASVADPNIPDRTITLTIPGRGGVAPGSRR